MPRAKQASKRKAGTKAVPVLGAAGLSLSLAGGASAGASGPAAEVTLKNTTQLHEITLAEEEISDVSLATFYVFDKENTGALESGIRLARGGGGGCGGCRGGGGGGRAGGGGGGGGGLGCRVGGGGGGGCRGCRGCGGRGCGIGGCGWGCGGCGCTCCLSWGGCLPTC
jgi:hypothetical protein